MMEPISKNYLICQIGGWGALFALPLINAGLYGHQSHIIGLSSILMLTGLVTTHLLRDIILKYGWLRLPFRKGLVYLLLAVVSACLLTGTVRYLGIGLFFPAMGERQAVAPLRFIFMNIIDSSLIIFPWTMIYILYAYTRISLKEKLNSGFLHVRFEEMKKSSAELGVDVDSMISSLSEIQLFIDQNPDRARNEITEFSKLLRRGYFKS